MEKKEITNPVDAILHILHNTDSTNRAFVIGEVLLQLLNGAEEEIKSYTASLERIHKYKDSILQIRISDKPEPDFGDDPVLRAGFDIKDETIVFEGSENYRRG